MRPRSSAGLKAGSEQRPFEQANAAGTSSSRIDPQALGQDAVALQRLRSAIEGNYLLYPSMDSNPLFARIQSRPEFAAIRTLAIEQQRRIVLPWKARQGSKT